MGEWNHYIVIERKPVLLQDMARALQEASADFYVDGDIIVLRGGFETEEHDVDDLECGQVTIRNVDDPALLPNRRFFEEWAATKRNRDRLMHVLDQAKTLVTMQLVNTSFWW